MLSHTDTLAGRLHLQGDSITGTKNSLEAHHLKITAQVVALPETKAVTTLTEIYTEAEIFMPQSVIQGDIIAENKKGNLNLLGASITGSVDAKSGENLTVIDMHVQGAQASLQATKTYGEMD